VQCIDDGGLVAAITERVCPTAAVGRLAAGDRVVRSCRGACLAEALVGRSGQGSAASGRVLGRGGIGKTRLLEAFSDAAESVGTGAFGTVAGAGECTTVLAVGAAIQAEAVASFPLRLPGWLRSERSACCSILLPEPRLPTLGPPGHYLNCCSKAGGRASHGISTLRAFLVFARRHARPSHVAVKRVLQFQHNPS